MSFLVDTDWIIDGNLIPDLDLLIAATAFEHRLVLLTRNRRHFERTPDLQVR